MLPESEDKPAGVPKTAISIPIAALVSQQLLTPPLSIRLGPRPVGRAVMPEATVNKNSHANTRERKVSAPPRGRNSPIDPITKALSVQG